VKSHREAIAKGGGQADLARTKMAMGTMFMATAVDLAADGMITGAGPDPKSEPGRFALWQRQGKQPYSINIGGRWYSYRGLEPWSTIFGWGASLGEWMQNSNFDDPDEELDWNAAVAHTIFSAAESGLSASFMQGMADVLAAIDDPDGRAASYLKRYLTTYTTPTIVREFGQMSDPYYRFTTDFIDETKKQWGFGENLPLQRDFYGRPHRGDSGVGLMYDFLSPFRSRRPSDQPIDQEWEKIGYAPTNPPKTMNVLGQGIKLNGDRYPIYSRWLELRGSTLPSDMGQDGRSLLSQIGNHTMLETLNMIVTGQHPLAADYQELPDAKKADYLRAVIAGYGRVAKAVTLREHPELLDLAHERNLREFERGETETQPQPVP
jgi:hypothetical protein